LAFAPNPVSSRRHWPSWPQRESPRQFLVQQPEDYDLKRRKRVTGKEARISWTLSVGEHPWARAKGKLD
jgi:hypothetical protein